MSDDISIPPTPTQPSDLLGDRAHRFVLGIGTLLYLIAFAPTLGELVREWLERPEYSHGFLMPLVAAYLLWERRDQIKSLRPKPNLIGTVGLLASLALLVLGEMKLSWFLKPYAFVAAGASMLWAFYGWRAVKICLPAIAALLLMCPLPGRVQTALTLPLKRTASLLATGALDLSGIPVSLEGNMIHLEKIDSLWVADACSGIRSLISLASLAILACFFWQRHWMLRTVMVVSSIPIAVMMNGTRIWLTGVLSVKFGPETAQGFFHFFEGFVMFGVSAVLLFAWAALLGAAFRGDRGS